MSVPDALARRWLRFAWEDLQAARNMVGRSDAYPRHACWLAQQSAEKALKAALIFLQVEYPFTHDLDLLRERLPSGWAVKDEQPHLFGLSNCATRARYPSPAAEAEEADAQAAIEVAQAIRDSVRADLAARGLAG